MPGIFNAMIALTIFGSTWRAMNEKFDSRAAKVAANSASFAASKPIMLETALAAPTGSVTAFGSAYKVLIGTDIAIS